VRCILIYRKRF
jgi:hypothetical protein